MKTSTCDILIVGAGPAGTSAAREAAGNGARVVVVERRSVIGVPVQCAEYIPAPFLGEADVGRHFVVQSIRGLRTFLNGCLIQESMVPGFTIRRDLFDRTLADAAESAGAVILLSAAAVSRDGNGAVMVRQKGFDITINAGVIIGADGPRSRVGKWIGSTNSNLIPALQVKVSLTRPMECAEVHFYDRIYGGYGWLFPKGDEANVGLGMLHRRGGAPPIGNMLRKFFSQLLRQGKITGMPHDLVAGWIPAEPPRTMTRENILLAGDAAGHTHPITGAGIPQAVIGGRMAGKWAARAVQSGDMKLLAEYESEWTDFFGEALEHGFRRRRLLEQEWGRLEEIIKNCWTTFREYYEPSERHVGPGAGDVVA